MIVMRKSNKSKKNFTGAVLFGAEQYNEKPGNEKEAFTIEGFKPNICL